MAKDIFITQRDGSDEWRTKSITGTANKYLQTDGTGELILDDAVVPGTVETASHAIYAETAETLLGSIDSASHATYAETAGTVTWGGVSGAPDFVLESETSSMSSLSSSYASTASYVNGQIIEPAEFFIKDYIRDLSQTSIDAVLTFNTESQNASLNTTAIRSAFDDALAFVQQPNEGMAGANVIFPTGIIMVNDELLSDAFQATWWAGTNLFKNQYLRAVGKGSGVTTIKIDDSWTSAVRNTANGNQRTSGPWQGSPSPSAVFPIMAQKPGLAEFSIQSMTLDGRFIPGKDPIPILSANEYAAKHTDLRVLEFANHGEVIQGGAFNSFHSFYVFEDCGCQPSDSGIATMGKPAGFPPYWVKFDVSGNTITAKAAAAFDGYSENQLIPYFQPAMVGKTLVVSDITQIYFESTPIGTQPMKVTISVVGSADSSTATFTNNTGQDLSSTLTGNAGSFLPVKGTTTAGSSVVTLSSPVLIGDGASDMVGWLVCIPKAGNVARVATSDLMMARILSVSNGDDTNGYSELGLSVNAVDAVTEDVIFGCSHLAHSDPAVITGISGFSADELRMDDVDFIQCRWELSRGYDLDQVTSAYQFLLSGGGEAVQYTSCKIHGATPVDRSNYALDGAAIIDDCDGTSFIGTDFTHLGFGGSGSIRFTGLKNQVNFTGCAIGGWKLPHDFTALYADPITTVTYIPDLWQVTEVGTLLKNDLFPYGDQKFLGWSSEVGDFRDVFGPRDRETRVDTVMSVPSGSFISQTSSINTVGKFGGKIHYNYDDQKIYYAYGINPTDTWRASDGSTTYTPS